MKHISIGFAIAALITACQSDQNAQQISAIQPDVHKVVVEEVLQTTGYTYLRVKENESEQWLAVTKMAAAAGEIWYYKDGFPIKEFNSKELKRTFKDIVLVDQISSSPQFTANPVIHDGGFSPTSPHGQNSPHEPVAVSGSNPVATMVKQEIKIEPAKNGITIAALYKNKKSYSGKTVLIKGQVTKYNPGIMNKNWLHLQDGTDHEGKFDLTATTDMEVKVGDIITLQGAITLDKDFGFGYAYEVIMEDAKLVE